MHISHLMPIIWIIDDDFIGQFASAYKFEQAAIDCEVKSYSSAVECVQIIEGLLNTDARLPDVILLDLQMPVMDGWAFLKILKEMGSPIEDIAIYIVSSYFKSIDPEQDLQFKFVRGHFNKPISKDDVEKIIAYLEK